jgi:hypothetical protein
MIDWEMIHLVQPQKQWRVNFLNQEQPLENLIPVHNPILVKNFGSCLPGKFRYMVQ